MRKLFDIKLFFFVGLLGFQDFLKILDFGLRSFKLNFKFILFNVYEKVNTNLIIYPCRICGYPCFCADLRLEV